MKVFFLKIVVFFVTACGFISSIFTPKLIPDFSDEVQPIVKETYSVENADVRSFDIFVSPDGDDLAVGKIDSPLKTIGAAKEKLKKLINADVGDVTVWLREGSYIFDSALSFGSGDLNHVTFCAYNDEKVVFTAGVPLMGFSEETVNGVTVWTKNLPSGFSINTLCTDDAMLRTARMPESGYYFVDSVDENDNLAPDSDLFAQSTSFYAAAGDLRPLHNMNDVVIRILHYWKDEIVTVTGFDTETNKITLSRPTSMTVSKGQKYFLENVFEALNEPGEWYFDNVADKLYYVPRESDRIDSATLYACSTETLINIDGLNDIRFKGITFTDTAFKIPRNNAQMDLSSQAGYDSSPCIYATNCSGLGVIGCSFKNLGSCAVKIGRNTQKATIESCLFENIGAQAVFICGENLPLDNPSVTKDITVKDCHIYKYGRNLFNSVGILVIHANSCNIENNEIHDGYYTGISVGWVWGYGYTVTDNIKVTDNLIYDIGQGWLSDMGGIYTLGTQPNSVISGNVIYNVAADSLEGGYGGWGIYLDEGTSYMTVERNLVYDCGSQCFHQHYGKENVLRNNIFAFGREGNFRVSRKEEHNSLTAEGNIFVTDRCPAYIDAQKGKMVDENNLYWDYTFRGNCVSSDNSDSKDGSSWIFRQRMCRWGYYENAVFADPLFKNAKGFDFTLALNSPAVTDLGFETWDYNDAGTLTDYTNR